MKMFCIVMLFILSANAFAKTTADIFTGSSSANVVMTQTLYEEYQTRFNIGLGYDHAFSGGLQLGAGVAANFGTSYNYYSLLVGPAYNFNSEDIENSFYAGVKAGVFISNLYGFSTTDAIVSAEISKRFKLAEGISYVPGIESSKVLGPNSEDPTIVFNIFKFSLLF